MLCLEGKPQRAVEVWLFSTSANVLRHKTVSRIGAYSVLQRVLPFCCYVFAALISTLFCSFYCDVVEAAVWSRSMIWSAAPTLIAPETHAVAASVRVRPHRRARSIKYLGQNRFDLSHHACLWQSKPCTLSNRANKVSQRF